MTGWLCLPGGAHATFGCSVHAPAAGFAVLYTHPDEASEAIRKVPHDAMVSLIDDPPQPASPGWNAVTHDEAGSDRWGDGTFGWMRAEVLADCG